MARRYAVPSGSTHDFKVAGTTRQQISGTGVAVTGTLSSTGALSSTAGVSGTTGTYTGAVSAVGVTDTGGITTTRAIASGTALAVGGRAFSQTTQSTAITNTNTETVFDQGVYSIPASTLTAGTVLKVKFSGTVPNTHTSDTLTVKLLIGGTTTNTTGTALLTSAALDVADGDVFSGELYLTARAAPGAAAACAVAGSIGIGPLTTGSMRPQALAATNLATNAALPVKVSATWSAADVGNICYLQTFVVEVL